MTSRSTWLFPHVIDRQRFYDTAPWLRHARAVAMVLLVVALALTPGVELWIFGVLGWWVALWLASDRAARRGGRAELWATWAMANSILATAVVVAGTGGATSSFRYWMVLPVAGVMTRYSPRGIAVGLALAFASLIVAMIVVNPHAAFADPSLVTTPVALVGAVATMCWAMMRSETSQRADAIVDPLTGLLNRKALASRAAAASYHATLTGAPVSLLMCDLDHFKRVNDEHGHAAGDAVLRDAAYALRGNLRTFDGAFRIGGEEFVLLLPDVEPPEALALAQRIRRAVEQARPAGISVTASVGVATLSGDQATLEQLLAHADTALYAAKRAGRNRVTVAPAIAEHGSETNRDGPLPPGRQAPMIAPSPIEAERSVSGDLPGSGSGLGLDVACGERTVPAGAAHGHR